MKSVQGDSGHAQVKMVADVYSHIIDEDRRLNAQRFEEAFYSGQSSSTPAAGRPASRKPGTGCRRRRRDQPGASDEASAEAGTGGNAESAGTGDMISGERAGQRRALLFLCRFLW